MLLKNQITAVPWVRILLFYAAVLAATFFARKVPNMINVLLGDRIGFPLPFNYNHGIAALLVSLLFYRFSRTRRTVSLFGTSKLRSLIFPLVLFLGYGAYGMRNGHGLDPHLWALLICSFAFIYNIMEEFAWRGFLPDSLGRAHIALKASISGICWACWHMLVFSDFNQYGGFGIFLLFCIVFSFILNFAVMRTRSVIVAAAIHAFIIQTNIVAVFVLTVFAILLFTWKKPDRVAAGAPERRDI